MNVLKRNFNLLALTLLMGAGSANAEIQVHGTRVIYPAEDREVTIAVDNVGKSPRLLQVWVDSGDDKETADTTTAPFLLTPPMSRVEPNKSQSFRLMFTGETLPQDRESVFWFNVLEIPPTPTDHVESEKNYLQFAVRTRLKIFYRPKDLPGDPLGAMQELSWRLIEKGGQKYLECTNPSAFNVSIANIRLKGTPYKEDFFPPGGMCPAKGMHQIAIPEQPGGAEGKLIMNAINDHGGFVEYEASFTR